MSSVHDVLSTGGRREGVQAAVDAIRRGELIVLPTDTVYGVAVSSRVAGATGQLFALKARETAQPLAVLVADLDQGLDLVDLSRLDVAAAGRVRRLMEAHWPGALTLVLPRATAHAELALGGDPSTIGVRCPSSEIVRTLAARVGPLVTTSANRSGEPTPSDAAQAAESLTGAVSVVIDGGACTVAPSTVLDATGNTFRLLRDGPISIDVSGGGADDA